MDHNKAKKVARFLAIILAAAMIITSLSFVVFLPGIASAGGVVYAADSSGQQKDLEARMDVLEEMIKEIQKNYKDEISYDRLVEGAFQGVFEALDDPFSVYYSTVEELETFVDNAAGEFGGVGVSIEMYEGDCRVVAPLSGTPAEKAGIRTGDIIREVDGVSVSGMTLTQVSGLLKGETGTQVKVTIERDGQTLELALTRETIVSTTVSGQMLSDDIGYIRIAQFGVNTGKEFRVEKLKLLHQGAQALIIDARNNPGGVMSAAVDIANQLMEEEGPILHFSQKGEIVETVMSDGTAERTVPVVMLVNEGSASATEALAGALQDSGTAQIVGTTTYGKGVAQQVAEIEGGASFKLSTYYFLTPDQHVIDHQGISPDYAVYNGLELTQEQVEKIYSELAPMTETIKYKAGETGLNVYAAQQRLQYLGYDVQVNGSMDESTVAAIQKFQKEQGFSPYGGLDYTTMNALSAAFDDYIQGGGEDRQLDKAVELLTK